MNRRQFAARNKRRQRERNGTKRHCSRGDKSQSRVGKDVYTERVGGSIPSPPTTVKPLRTSYGKPFLPPHRTIKKSKARLGLQPNVLFSVMGRRIGLSPLLRGGMCTGKAYRLQETGLDRGQSVLSDISPLP